jgi:ABC-2 type transport system permease protein
MLSNSAKLILRIPANFEKDIMRENSAKLQMIIDAEDGSAAGVISSYTASVISDFGNTFAVEKLFFNPSASGISIKERYFYNPELEYKHFMVPGILGVLITVIGFAISGLNLVREKEIGTIEQLNVTPIKKYQFIAGKLIPFWIIGLFEMAFGLLLAKLIFDIFIVGSLFVIFAVAGIYLLVVLSFGLIVSASSSTQQQSLFVTYFLLLIIILMSGLFTPIESMPQWAQYVAFADPFSHFAEVLRRVLLKGAGFYEVREQIAVLSCYAILAVSFAVFKYKKVSE